MNTHRSGFTIVEALVATAIVGIASAALAMSLAASSRLRMRAAAQAQAAQVSAQRVAVLAVRSCAAADTGGAGTGPSAYESWTARRSTTGWSYTDSIAIPPGFSLRVNGVVACSP